VPSAVIPFSAFSDRNQHGVSGAGSGTQVATSASRLDREGIKLFSESIADSLCDVLGHTVYVVIAFGLMTGVPLCLLVLFFVGLVRRYGSRFGLLLGFAWAIWSSACWEVVPYLGGYPNLPGAVIGGIAFGVDTWGQDITVHVMNLILWPLSGWLLFHFVGRTTGVVVDA
jgi:hypothetical protein